MDDRFSRRAFLATGGVVCAGLYAASYFSGSSARRRLKALKTHGLDKGVAVVHGENPRAMTQKAVESLGGMSKLVSKGDVVVIKPNMAWERTPDRAANTNPDVVAALVEMCVAAGAARVKVIEHTISPNPRPAYEMSGIAEAAKRAGAQVLFVDQERFHELPIPNGKALKSWPFYEDFVFADRVDVLINVPAAKHHSTSRLSMGLKNVFGMIGGERGALHKDIHPKIADLNRVLKIDLTVLDAYRILTQHGPSGNSLADVDNSPERARRIVVSTDPVAVDAYGATLFGLKPDDIGFIREAHEAGLGELDFKVTAELAV